MNADASSEQYKGEFRLDGNKVWNYEQYYHTYFPSFPDPGFDLLWEKLPLVEVVYNSEADTLKHIKRVNQLLLQFSQNLMTRAMYHDDSKLQPEEKLLFDEMTPKLASSVYGSDDYKKMLDQLKISLDHHYKHNTHHPEHYPNGVDDMTLMDIVEMFVDWKAATERHDNGDIYKSFDVNKTRFKMSEQLYNIFKNTAKNLLW